MLALGTKNEGGRGGAGSPPLQGATVLHCLARLHEIAIQGATQGATKCNMRCYILKSLVSEV
jgi:hypothetical protein